MGKIYSIHISDKGPECRICKELLQIKEKRPVELYLNKLYDDVLERCIELQEYIKEFS